MRVTHTDAFYDHISLPPQMSVAQHPFLAFIAASALVFAMISALRKQAVRMSHAQARLPYNTKGD